MEITPNGTVFLLSHRGGIAPEADSLILELTIALTKENAIAGKGEVFRLTFPANHAEKIISSIQTALQRLTACPTDPSVFQERNVGLLALLID